MQQILHPLRIRPSLRATTAIAVRCLWLAAVLAPLSGAAAASQNPHIYHRPSPATDQDRVTIYVEGQETSNCIPNLYQARFLSPSVIELRLAYPGGDPGPFCSAVITSWKESVTTEHPLAAGWYEVRVVFTRNGHELRSHVYRFQVFATGHPSSTLAFDRREHHVSESAHTAFVTVERTGSSHGTVSVGYETADGTAQAGHDYEHTTGTLTWHDGDLQPKQVAIPILDDFLEEGDEHFSVVLRHPGGEAHLGAISEARLTIEDDDAFESTSCRADSYTLCLNQGRFAVTTRWRTTDGQSGRGRAKTLTDDSGSFWFFEETNVEVLVKMLDGCQISGSYWLFASGMTDVWVEIAVEDTVTGERGTWTNPQGVDFQLLKDISRFGGCR